MYLDPHEPESCTLPTRCSSICMLSQVASASVILCNSKAEGQAKRVAACDLEQLVARVQLSPEVTHSEVTLQDMTLLDLTQGFAGTADTLLTRWQQPGWHTASLPQQAPLCNSPCEAS